MGKLFTRAEERRRKMRFQILAGVFDFVAILAGLVVIVMCLLLLSTLVRWTIKEIPIAFQSLWSILERALIVPE